MNYLFYFVPVASIIALFFAWLFYHQMKKENEGTPTMKEIAQYVRACSDILFSLRSLLYRSLGRGFLNLWSVRFLGAAATC